MLEYTNKILICKDSKYVCYRISPHRFMFFCLGSDLGLTTLTKTIGWLFGVILHIKRYISALPLNDT